MSEYQYYEFLAEDRPLDEQAQAEVRALSTRAEITDTSFVNEYHWGDFRGDPDELVERYYDAHLHLTDWGTRRVLLRLPLTLLDPAAVEPYRVDDQVEWWTTDEHLVLDLANDDAEAEDGDYDPTGALSAIIGVRHELATGDHRALYLAWLAAYGTWERDECAFDREADNDVEPPVPPGLRALTAPQRALAGFLRLDDDLLAVAAEASPPRDRTAEDPERLATWLTGLPAAEKDRLLLRVVRNEAAAVRTELLHRFHREAAPAGTTAPPGRTVADLLDETARRRTARHDREAAELAEEEARREAARAAAHERRLDRLAEDRAGAWERVHALIATYKPADYDTAVELLADLRALARRDGRTAEFTRRCATLRDDYARRPSLVERLNRANL
ncbi:hypothetical protein [Saccharothrix algeriensis]|uniref:Uncharacterized protein n=1 Tax=Saccharothrix algeriensis TaxID=173560 RepID=A0A8T8I348_9PSEU|nr:hypothetical protein [Saccharothrix algeriensis]MBM7811228.1 hypothetical protein [Saccharothrix algeriensis]QTR05137.1 hypothetical protein J7S33_10770 [Saccharothrix algeriensis]